MTHTRSAKNFAELRVYSEALAPAEIAARVGVEPDKVRERSKPPRANGPYAWIAASTLDRAQPTEAPHVKDLPAWVGPIVGEMRLLSEAHEVAVIYAAYPYSQDDYNPGLCLDRHALAAIRALGPRSLLTRRISSAGRSKDDHSP